ncbi:MAG TPA: class I SAM-dependent methyltransferase [Candidatus Acidoferrales bacterium]|nr:class I SAM-dependent methyltransferase [Candidatus Acidoferrales bacterium]
MQRDKVKVKLSGRSASMLGCLWCRAQVSKKYSSLFCDATAVELAEKIDYVPDYSASDVPPFEGIMFNLFRKINQPEFGLFALRAQPFDDKAKEYIAEHPQASVVNIGAGLDTTFYRVDNGLIHWYDLDLPAVIDVRRQLLSEPERVTYIAKSLLDPGWFKDVTYTEDGVFMIAGGVLHSLKESQVRQFFSMLADKFPGGEIVFDAALRSDGGFITWIDMFPPEQRDAIRAAWMEALNDWWENAMKDWWEKTPQDQKDKLNEVITAFEIPTKPKGTKWSDLEAWWNHLSDTKKAGVSRDLMTAFRGRIGTWVPNDINEIARLDSRISVIDHFPMFKNIPRDSLGVEMRRFMDYNDSRGEASIIHLRVR